MELSQRTKVEGLIAELLAEHDDRAPFGDSESLIKAGRLDSLAVAKIVTFLETACGRIYARGVRPGAPRFDCGDRGRDRGVAAVRTVDSPRRGCARDKTRTDR